MEETITLYDQRLVKIRTIVSLRARATTTRISRLWLLRPIMVLDLLTAEMKTVQPNHNNGNNPNTQPVTSPTQNTIPNGAPETNNQPRPQTNNNPSMQNNQAAGSVKPVPKPSPPSPVPVTQPTAKPLPSYSRPVGDPRFQDRTNNSQLPQPSPANRQQVNNRTAVSSEQAAGTGQPVRSPGHSIAW